MTDSPRNKAAKTSRKKAGKKVAKKAAKKVAKKPATAELGPLVLASHPNIKDITELKASLTAAHSADSDVIIDAGEVESIDTAALQLLAAFANAQRQQSRTVEWKQPSTVFCESAGLLALTENLGIDATSPAEDDGLCPVF